MANKFHYFLGGAPKNFAFQSSAYISGDDLDCSSNNSMAMNTTGEELKAAWKVGTASTIFVVVLPFIFFEIPFFPIDTTVAVLAGAFFMVVTTIIDQDYTYELLGGIENMRTIFLLLGMMLLAQYFEREHMINKIFDRVLKDGLGLPAYLARIGILSFFLSALFTNDATCLILTPLILKHWKNQNRNVDELETVLLCIATNSNIGSSMTIFGNPQMALIAAVTNSHLYSRLDLVTCVMYIGPPALVAYFANWGFLILHYRWGCARKTEPLLIVLVEDDDAGYGGKDASGVGTDDALTDSVENVSALSNSFRHGAERETSFLTSNSKNKKKNFTGSLKQEKVSDSKKNKKIVNDHDYSPSENKYFQTALCAMVILVIALFFASTKEVQFDIGLVPMGAAILTMLFDAGINKRNALQIMKRIDWSVIMLFFGFFVWLGALNYTGLPQYFWVELGLNDSKMETAMEIVMMTVFVIIGSNIFSNVPLTILVLAQLHPCKDQLAMVLYLAWVATISGNLTLFGSVANLIVAQKSLQTLRFRLTFWAYLKYGFVTTMIITIFGVCVIYGLLLI